MQNNDLMEKIVSLCKRRGFVFPGSEIYGGLANSWDYGPLGVELKNNIKNLWWERFVHRRDDMVGIDAALIMNPKVWEASGHLQNFADALVECKKCHTRFRLDQIPGVLTHHIFSPQDNNFTFNYEHFGNAKCANCGALGKEHFTLPMSFNLMFKTFLGPAEEKSGLVYLRPETAQGMFVNFKNILDTMRKTLPFGIAQIGPAFRNEITPGNFIFRTREFEQMEIEYFVRPSEWKKWFEYWLNEQKEWLKEMGIEKDAVFVEIPEADRAHYSKRSVDTEYKFPFGQKELYGLAYRSDYDLSQHQKMSGQSLEYTDPHTNDKFLPHVIEPTWGVNRTFLAVLCSAHREQEDRVYLALPPKLAPYKAAVFPLLKNKPELVSKAKEIYDDLRKHFTVAWDERGNVGKRYYSQDEIGTPYCVTVDFDTLEKGIVTVRDRDTKEQATMKVGELQSYIAKSLL